MNITSVLLLGAENILALSVIRTLGSIMPEAKIHTLSPFNGKKPVSERSKYIDSRHYFSGWKDENFHSLLKNKIKETGADLVLPVSEQSVRKLSMLQDDLKGSVYLPPLPTTKVYDQLERKDDLASFLSSRNFAYAKTWQLNETDVSRLDDEIFPLMLKPIWGSSGVGIQKIDDRESLEKIITEIDKQNYILQEYLPGRDYGCSILAIDGEIKAYTIQKVLANKKFGVATAIRFLHNEQILKTTRQVVKKTGYSGVAHLDYRLDDRDGKAKLIDFNARFWFSLLGSKAAGIDFVFLTCLAAAGISFEPPDYRHITYFVGSNTLLYYLKKAFHLKQPNISPQKVFTDLWDRIGDPIPEIARYIP